MNKYFQIAKKIALSKKDKRAFLMGALAIRKDGVIVGALNGPVKTPEPWAHAEARLSRKMGYGATVYIVRVLRTGGRFAIAKPCETCMNIMRSRKVKKIYYTIDNNSYGVINL